MGNHVSRQMTSDSAIAELRAKLSIPSRWEGIVAAREFVRPTGKHASTHFAKNVKAMRAYYVDRDGYAGVN